MTYKCKKCNVSQALSEFYKTTDRKCGHKTVCKTCIKATPASEKQKAYMREYSKDYHLKRSYGLSREEHTQLLIKQNHKCGICGIDEKEAFRSKLYVDHCHDSGKIRELLCHNCNASLGLLKESISTLTKAIAYLDKYRKQGE